MRFLIAVLITSVVACDEGSSKKFTSASEKQTGVAEVIAEDAINSSGCSNGEQGITQAELLTPLIDNNDLDKSLQYKILVTDCDENVIGFDAEIEFDILAGTSNFGQDLPYELASSDGTSLTRGVLLSRFGRDLFGNTGDNYAHHHTEKVSVDESEAYVILTIDLGDAILSSMEDSGELGNRIPRNFEIDSLLRVGETSTVRKPIRIK